MRISDWSSDVCSSDLTRFPVLVGDLVDLARAGGDAGQVRGGRQARLVNETSHGRMRALAGRAAGAVSHRHEARVQPRKPGDGIPPLRFPQFGQASFRERVFQYVYISGVAVS